MFYEKWFDKGDLISHQTSINFAVYDEYENPYTVSQDDSPQIAMFMEYLNKDSYDSCKIYVFSLERCIVVPQYEIKLLSKNTDYSSSKD